MATARNGRAAFPVGVVPDSLQERTLMNAAEITRYLGTGGLLQILASHSPSPREVRVWLTPTPDGRWRHTFRAEPGAVGGDLAPFWAVRGDRISPDRVVDVV